MPALAYPAPLTYPDGRRITCDSPGCGFVFTRSEDVCEMDASVLTPYPDTLTLCPSHADALHEEQRDDHVTAQADAREKGWHHYGSGWSVPYPEDSEEG